MSTVTGIIQEIQAKQVAGGRTVYNIVVAGQSYGAGLYPPKAKEGDYVKFEVDESRGYKNVAARSLQVSKNKPPAEAVAAASSAKPMSSDARQETISRQAASNTAVAYIQALINAGAVAAPSTKGKAQEYFDIMLEMYTKKFYESNTGAEWKDISPASKPASEAAEDAPPFDVEDAPADDQWQ